jgi:PKD repeat protein
MIKRFLLNQRIYRRMSPFFNHGGLNPRLLTAASTMARTVLRRVRDVVHARQFLPVAGGSLFLAASIALCVLLIPSKGASPLPLAPSVASVEAVDARNSTPRGSGVASFSRDQDVEYTVLDGQTFSEIAYLYKINVDKLAMYNHIADINKIKEGMTIIIPSEAAEKKIAVNATLEAPTLTPASNPSKLRISSVPLKIEAEQQFDGMAVTAHFSVESPPNVNLTRFEWDLGNGRKSFRPTTFWTYDSPGTYTVSLTAADADGRQYDADEVFIDVPHPTTYQNTLQQFLTLESLERTFTVRGKITDVIHYDGRPDSPITEVSSNADGTSYRATRPGYFSLEVEKDDAIHHVYVFVSPVDTKHSDRTDLNWYRTQFNTGTQSNCGPAVASMAISWATGEYVAVSTVRQEIGWTGNGSTSFEDIIAQIKTHGVVSRLVSVSSSQDLFDIIDRGNIAIILYNSGGPRFTRGHPADDFFGRYYYDAVGHYVVIKGYSRDGQYLVTYDPIPSDWGSNSFRYGDGISMIGRNRYYGTKELFGALRRWDVIEIMR